MTSRKVILIDGSQPYMVSLKFILEKNHYSVAVKSLSDLKEESKEERIIIIDAQATNLDLLRNAKENTKIIKETDKILLLTEYDCEDFSEIFRNAEIFIVLKKPFAEKDFIKMLTRMDIINIILEKKMKKLEESINKFEEKMNKLDDYMNELSEERVSNIENKIKKRIKLVMERLDIDDEDKSKKI